VRSDCADAAGAQPRLWIVRLGLQADLAYGFWRRGAADRCKGHLLRRHYAAADGGWLGQASAAVVCEAAQEISDGGELDFVCGRDDARVQSRAADRSKRSRGLSISG